jgi:hypothetical protein
VSQKENEEERKTWMEYMNAEGQYEWYHTQSLIRGM